MPSSACDWSSDVCSSDRSEEHTSELQSRSDLVCRLLLEKKKKAISYDNVLFTDSLASISQSDTPTSWLTVCISFACTRLSGTLDRLSFRSSCRRLVLCCI